MKIQELQDKLSKVGFFTTVFHCVLCCLFFLPTFKLLKTLDFVIFPIYLKKEKTTTKKTTIICVCIQDEAVQPFLLLFLIYSAELLLFFVFFLVCYVFSLS